MQEPTHGFNRKVTNGTFRVSSALSRVETRFSVDILSQSPADVGHTSLHMVLPNNLGLQIPDILSFLRSARPLLFFHVGLSEEAQFVTPIRPTLSLVIPSIDLLLKGPPPEQPRIAATNIHCSQ